MLCILTSPGCKISHQLVPNLIYFLSIFCFGNYLKNRWSFYVLDITRKQGDLTDLNTKSFEAEGEEPYETASHQRPAMCLAHPLQKKRPSHRVNAVFCLERITSGLKSRNSIACKGRCQIHKREVTREVGKGTRDQDKIHLP